MLYDLFMFLCVYLCLWYQVISEWINATYSARNKPLTHESLSLVWSVVVSIFCVGGMIGALGTGYVGNRFGRFVQELFIHPLPEWLKSYSHSGLIILRLKTLKFWATSWQSNCLTYFCWKKSFWKKNICIDTYYFLCFVITDRKGGLLLNNILALIGGVLEGIALPAVSPEVLILGRFFVGVNCGLNAGLAPMYLTEISPVHLRGTVSGT